MEQKLMKTDFAPAERCSKEEIHRQTALFTSSPLMQFIDFVPNIVLVLNKYRQMVYANKTAKPLLETTDLAAAYGLRTGEFWDCSHAYDTEGGCGTTTFCRQCGAVKAILSSLRGEEDMQECRITQKKSGDAIDLRVWTYPVTVEGEQFTVFVAADIVNEKRREILERIFLHDIMNTVGNIKSFADILKEVEAKDAEEFRGLIYDLSSRLVDEINAHRELIAAEKNELIVHPETIDSLGLLEDIKSYYAKSALGNNFTITISPASQKAAFISDGVLIRRILGNMLKNALEASTPRDVVTLSSAIDGETIEFSVHNPGYIPPEVQLQIFQRSFSTKGAGRGLGTYGMRLLTERYLRGTVSFVSSEKEGTTFKARYPLK